ncbi:phosphatase PAP2 family protein [Streptomyces sp. NPDC050095]|uniref:phosphatase PAP2 family protein n=1 Tax=unclassified Streptomyces TaxID=2593676 RepID=UPI003426DE9D
MTARTATAAFFDDSLYSGIAHLTDHTPDAVNTLITLWSDWGLVLFAALLIWAWLRARAEGRSQLPSLAAPLAVVVAFGVNDVVKSVLREARPCQVLHVTPLQACPGAGDWSFPSNHAAIAAAAAAALWCVDRRLALLAVPAALLMAFSRVWVGAHYPHDALAGLVVGAVVALVLMRVLLHFVSRRHASATTPSEVLTP